MDSELAQLVELMLRKNASDLILTEGQPPILRVVGDLTSAYDHVAGADKHPEAKLTSEQILRMAATLLSLDQQKEFERTNEADSSFGLEGRARFRVNVFRQRGAAGIVIRALPYTIPSIDALGVPAIVKKWLDLPHGILITTGPTGSGKSTSQAAMLGWINQHKPYHIVTIEDPIEYVHQHGTCTVEQREVGRDTPSFASALRHVFRQSPDVIMIGEMRDRETFESALQLAETGHLVLATLHTGDAMQSISRIVDVFPPEQHQQIRVQLSLTIIGVLVQQLVPTIDGRGRVLALEVLEATPAVRNLIRKNELQQLYSIIQTSANDGMFTMNHSLLQLFKEGKVSLEQARLFTTRQKEFDQLLQREGHIVPTG